MTLRSILTLPGQEAAPTPPLEVPPKDRFLGAILGCAIGDAVGCWAERRSLDELKDFVEETLPNFAFDSLDEFRGIKFGQYTDDTQLTRELSLSLIQEKGFHPEDFAGRIAKMFALKKIVGYGGATLQAALKLLDGAFWDEAGTPPPRAGNGAAMRAGPIGLFFYYDTQLATTHAVNQSIITHKAPESVAGGVAIAIATSMAILSNDRTTGPHEIGWWAWLANHVQVNSEDFANDIRAITKIAFDGRKKRVWEAGSQEEFDKVAEYVLEFDDDEWEGVSPYARSSVLWALYSVMASPKDLWGAVTTAIKIGGDADTIAAMAATVVGAHIGLDKFPKEVMEHVAPKIHDVKAKRYDWGGLHQLASDLHDVVTAQYQGRLEKWQAENQPADG